MITDATNHLPPRLVRQATAEHAKHGMVLTDTASLLMQEHGLYPHDIDRLVMEQAAHMEMQ
jgi:hypothetical protein